MFWRGVVVLKKRRSKGENPVCICLDYADTWVDSVRRKRLVTCGNAGSAREAGYLRWRRSGDRPRGVHGASQLYLQGTFRLKPRFIMERKMIAID